MPRTRRHVVPELVALATLFGCAVYPPPVTFSSGTQWTFPLVDPLREDKLLTAIVVDGRGPFLVALDPEAKETSIDREIVSDNWGEQVKPRVDLANIVIGDLTISTLSVAVNPRDGTLDDEGRRIFGVIGRDVLPETLAFGFDRDRGVAWLAQLDELHVGSATKLSYEELDGRRALTATINGHVEKLAVELGEVPSQLRRSSWGSDGLAAQTSRLVMVDRTGARRELDEIGIAHGVGVDGVRREGVSFIPYVEPGSNVAGTLGLDFFRPYVVTAAWQRKALYLTARAPSGLDDTARLSRWGRQLLDACGSPGCVELTVLRVELDDGSERVEHIAAPRVWLAGLTERPAAVFTFQAARDPIAAGNDLQVIVDATDKGGRPLPRVEIDLPAGADTATAPADARYAGATLKVVDISPFPRLCGHGVVGCIALEPTAPP